MKIHHIGIVTKSIRDYLDKYLLIDDKRECGKIFINTVLGVKLVLIKTDTVDIELIEPIDERSTVHSIAKRKSNILNHICLETKKFEENINMLKERGFLMFVLPFPAEIFDNRRVCFFASPNGEIYELLEK